MPRPRGGDWLEDEIQAWRRSGVDCVLSLLTADEIADLNLIDEEELCRANGIAFHSFPIEDRDVPESKGAFSDLLAKLTEELLGGKNVAVHCRQGIGRAGMVAIGLLVMSGMDLESAINRTSAARGIAVPETTEQRLWVIAFAKSVLIPVAK